MTTLNPTQVSLFFFVLAAFFLLRHCHSLLLLSPCFISPYQRVITMPISPVSSSLLHFALPTCHHHAHTSRYFLPTSSRLTNVLSVITMPISRVSFSLLHLPLLTCYYRARNLPFHLALQTSAILFRFSPVSFSPFRLALLKAKVLRESLYYLLCISHFRLRY